jgi:outer membrane protein
MKARTILSPLCLTAMLYAQQPDIAPVRPSKSGLVRPYLPSDVPPIRLNDSMRLRSLIRSGMLYLTVRDAIALALENNLDVEVARYNPILSEWQLERSIAGGALPGVPNAASQAGAVAAGQGVTGSQAAAGVTTGFAGVAGAAAGNATISQIGPVTQTLDPSIQESNFFSHVTTPQQNTVQSYIQTLVDDTRAYTGAYQQGFLVGGNVTLSYKDSYLNENAPTDVLNPSSAPSLSVTYQQNLLRGFGIAVNERTIRVSRLNLKASQLNFKTQVINTVTSVLNAYYGLVADNDDVRAKRDALQAAQKLLADNTRKEQLGAAAHLDVTTAGTQVASTESDLIVSQTALLQQELQLKVLLSRTGLADPAFASANIVPLDRIVVPERDDLPTLEEMIRIALASRPDLASERLGLTSAQMSARGTVNGVLPNLQLSLQESVAALTGTGRTVTVIPGLPTSAVPYVEGGIGNALAQLFRRDFPTNHATLFLQAPVHNRQALADQTVDQLQLRQTELSLNRDLNQVSVAISNYAVAVRQAQTRYRAAVQTGILENDLLAGEQKKLDAGLSTPLAVIQQQRDLAAARSSEIAAMVAYSNARVALDQTLGTTLEVNQVSLDEARVGQSRAAPSQLPRQ